MKIPYNILIQIKMSVRPYFKGFTLIFFFYNCRKQDYSRIRLLGKSVPLWNRQGDAKLESGDAYEDSSGVHGRWAGAL